MSQNAAEGAGEPRDFASVAQNGCGYSHSRASDVARRMELRVGVGDDRNDADERRRRRRSSGMGGSGDTRHGGAS